MVNTINAIPEPVLHKKDCYPYILIAFTVFLINFQDYNVLFLMAKKWSFEKEELVIHKKSRTFISNIHNCSEKSKNLLGNMLQWSSSLLKLEACDFATNELYNSPLHANFSKFQNVFFQEYPKGRI